MRFCVVIATCSAKELEMKRFNWWMPKGACILFCFFPPDSDVYIFFYLFLSCVPCVEVHHFLTANHLLNCKNYP